MNILWINALALLAMMTCVWGISVILQNVAIVDVFWGLGFVLTAWISAMQSDVPRAEVERWLLPVLTTLWGIRLAGHLAWRNLGQVEDRRYARIRAAGGPHFWWRSLVTVFWLQATLIWIVALPVQVPVTMRAESWNLLRCAGIVLWGIGFVFEAAGDWQLSRFKANPANRGRVMDQGLWKYTRHPNYFGDFCIWWGLYLIAVAAGTPAWTVVGPLVISFLLLRISGVTLLERDLQQSKPEYVVYMQRTSAFFPLPRKRNR